MATNQPMEMPGYAEFLAKQKQNKPQMPGTMQPPPGMQQMPGTKQPFPTPNQQPFPGGQQMPGTKQPFPAPTQQPFPGSQQMPGTKQPFPGMQQMPGTDNPRRPMPGFAPPKAPPGGQQSMTMAIPEGGGGRPGPIQSQGPGTGLAPGGQQSMTMAIPEGGGGMPGGLIENQPGTGLVPADGQIKTTAFPEGGGGQPFGYMPERFKEQQQIQPPTREQQEQAARDPMNQYNRAMMEYMDKNPNVTQEEAQKYEDQQRAKYGISDQDIDRSIKTAAVGENGGGNPTFGYMPPQFREPNSPSLQDEVSFGGPVQSREDDALNKQINLEQLMQPPRDRNQIIEDRAREQTIIDSPPGSPQRKHLEAGGKVADMPKPNGIPERDVQPGGYPVGGPTRDGSPGFLEPDPKNPHGSKQAEVKHNIEVERQKEAELGNKPTGGTTAAVGESGGGQATKPAPTPQQKPTAPTPQVDAQPQQEPTETDTPGPVKTEQPTPAVDTTPTDTRTTPQQRDAAQKFKDKRQERITGKKSMPFG